jgi:SpoVK/Ycf46/Vps4 family AAA+-type ATPase
MKPPKKTEDRIINYLRAGFHLFWLKTHEPWRVKRNIYEALQNFQLKNGGTFKTLSWDCLENADFLYPLAQLTEAEENSVMFMYNYHWYMDKMKAIQTIQNLGPAWANMGKAAVVVSPVQKIPVELEKDFVVLDLQLPKEEEIRDAARIAVPDEGYIPSDNEVMQRICRSAIGLTRQEIENVFSLSIVEHGKFDIATINDYKAMTIAKSGFLDVLPTNLTFQDVIGYKEIKDFIMDSIFDPRAKGLMTIGVPGCGKTTLMKSIVGETGKFGLSVNMGRLFGKYQGETDKNVDAVIELITAIGDCLVLIDEFEKQFAGAGSSGELDSGTTRRATGRWLEFLQDRPQGAYIVATANSFKGIPGEFLRPGRWDTSPFFIDLPVPKVRKNIMSYYANKADIPIPKGKDYPEMKDFTGAEIEAMVHIADMRGIKLNEAEKCVIPQAITLKAEINALREWAKDTCLPADTSLPAMVAATDARRRVDV